MAPGERGVLRDELGLSKWLVRNVIRLADVNDPEFQRYIQDQTRIPSIHGALVACRPDLRHTNGRREFSSLRKKRAGLKHPKNPSLDEGYALLVRSLGHLSAVASSGSPQARRAVSRALDHLYTAEDFIRPFRGGYDR